MPEVRDEELIPSSHPGEALPEEVITPLGLTAYGLAKALGVPTSRIDDFIAGRRAITADTAIRLGANLGMRPECPMAIQSGYELRLTKRKTKFDVKQRMAT